MPALDDIVKQNEKRYLEELFELLRVPSVSADPDHKQDLVKCAEMVAAHVKKLGFRTEIVPTAGHPIVIGERIEDPKLPTVLIYGHYDVQPADPLDLWDHGPFTPTIVDGNVIARGSTDDKGQFFAHLKGIESVLAAKGKLPVNVKLVIEGEEEVGSKGITDYLAQGSKRLACDVIAVSDSTQYAPGIPAICYGLRGILAMEIRVDGPKRDLHSGQFGGAVANPAEMLCRLIATAKDAEGRIAIPGFYDGVVPIEPAEREAFGSLPFDEKAYLREIGAEKSVGEPGYSILERAWARPTFEVNGLFGGYQGKGSKTIIPAWAGAKITCRLVPGQDPNKVYQAIVDHLRKNTPQGVRLTVSGVEHGSAALLAPREGPVVEAAARALEKGFGRKPVYIREGGSIPLLNVMTVALDAPVLLLGFGRADDRAHSPNEKFAVEDFYRGIRTSAHLLDELAAFRPA